MIRTTSERMELTPIDDLCRQLGKPVENAFIESFNRRLRDECVNVHQFASIAETQQIIEAWPLDYISAAHTAHSAT